MNYRKNLLERALSDDEMKWLENVVKPFLFSFMADLTIEGVFDASLSISDLCKILPKGETIDVDVLQEKISVYANYLYELFDRDIYTGFDDYEFKLVLEWGV